MKQSAHRTMRRFLAIVAIGAIIGGAMIGVMEGEILLGLLGGLMGAAVVGLLIWAESRYSRRRG
jgi:uncharacterized membrane protein